MFNEVCVRNGFQFIHAKFSYKSFSWHAYLHIDIFWQFCEDSCKIHKKILDM